MDSRASKRPTTNGALLARIDERTAHIQKQLDQLVGYVGSLEPRLRAVEECEAADEERWRAHDAYWAAHRAEHGRSQTKASALDLGSYLVAIGAGIASYLSGGKP